MCNECRDSQIKHSNHNEAEHLRVVVSLVSNKEECVRKAKRIMHNQHDEERKQEQEPDPV